MKTDQQARIPENENRLLGLDVLRAFAILHVIFFHYSVLFPHPDWITDVAAFGWTGVDLFFALSGFLIASQLFDKMVKGRPVSFREFFIKRFFRIMPAYLLVVAAYFFVPAWHERESLAPLWKYLTFTQNLGLDSRTMGTFSHAWSLCVEEQFYLFFPLILIALIYFKKLRFGFILLITLFIAGFAIRYFAYTSLVDPFKDTDTFYPRWYEFIYYPTYSRLDGLILGIVIAAIINFRPSWKPLINRNGNIFLVSGLAVWIVGYFLSQNQHTLSGSLFSFPVVDLGSALLVLGSVSRNSVLYGVRSAVLTWIATLSYSLYLIHKMTFHIAQGFLERLGNAASSNLTMLLAFVFTALIAWLMHRLVEKPFLKLRGRILNGSTARAVSKVAAINA